MTKKTAPLRFHKILGLEVKGGFLDGLSVDFDPHLNCVIGGRGTGKTTILEFLRFALKDPIKRMSQEVRKLVTGNLRTGHVRVRIETKEGLRYTVVRSASGEPSVLDDKDKATNLTLSHGSFFDLDVFSAHEIEGIATTPAAQTEILDRFRQDDLAKVAHDLRKIETELSSNALDLVKLAGERGSTDEQAQELKHVEEKLKALQASVQVGEQVEEALNQKRLAELEARELRLKTQQVHDRVGHLTRFEWLDTHRFPSEVQKGPHKAGFKKLSDLLDDTGAKIEELVKEAQKLAQAAHKELEAFRAELERDHRGLEVRYGEVLAKHERERDQAQEQMHLQRRQLELHEAQRAVQDKDKAIQAKLHEREALLERLAGLRRRRTEIRSEIAQDLSKRLRPLIQISMEPGADKTEYENLLSESLKGTGKQYTSVVAKLVKIPPGALAQMVFAQDADRLVDETALDRDRAVWVLQQLKDTKGIYDIETVDLQDKPKIELQHGTTYKDAGNLSTGQRCTAILPILLLESDKPLLIDQPEDNLDNEFIYSRIVTRLREVKDGRQMIFVTHNPNIPVLGDADLVVVMDSEDGKRAKPRADGVGTVTQCKDHIANLLEGGKQAFERRRERYGY